MKKCATCGRVYDDTWKICLNDNTALIDDDSNKVELPSQVIKSEDQITKTDKGFKFGFPIIGVTVYLLTKAIATKYPDSQIVKILNVMLVGLIAGALVGLIPYFVAMRKKYQRIAITSLVVCAISGALFGLIVALPFAVIITLAIMCYQKIRNKIQQNPGTQ